MLKCLKFLLPLALLLLSATSASATHRRVYTERQARNIANYLRRARVYGISPQNARAFQRIRLYGTRLGYLPLWDARVRFRNGATARVRNVYGYRRIGRRYRRVRRHDRLTLRKPWWARGPITRLSVTIRVWAQLRNASGVRYTRLRYRKISIRIGSALEAHFPRVAVHSRSVGFEAADISWVHTGLEADGFEIHYQAKVNPWDVATRLQKFVEVRGSVRSFRAEALQDGLWYHFVVIPVVFGRLRPEAASFTITPGGPSTGWIVNQRGGDWTGSVIATHLPGIQSFGFRLSMTTILPRARRRSGSGRRLTGGSGPTGGSRPSGQPEGSFTLQITRPNGTVVTLTGSWFEQAYSRRAGQRAVIYTHNAGWFRLTMNTASGSSLTGDFMLEGREYAIRLTR